MTGRNLSNKIEESMTSNGNVLKKEKRKKERKLVRHNGDSITRRALSSTRRARAQRRVYQHKSKSILRITRHRCAQT